KSTKEAVEWELPWQLTAGGPYFCTINSLFLRISPPFRLFFVLFVSFAVHSSAEIAGHCQPRPRNS
ncbi:MAG: hypothetical protein KDA60_15285, partial [Planctomycetales bacterium]|nr:hypothetical protein [Planctomycetales bacterium]